MIKKLRIKFVAAAMLAITLVLVAAMGIITVRGYVQIINRADEIIDILQKNDGKFPVKFAEKEADSGAYEFSADDLPPKLPEGNPEMRFETRFFAVVLSEDGGAVSVDVELFHDDRDDLLLERRHGSRVQYIAAQSGELFVGQVVFVISFADISFRGLGVERLVRS